MMTTSIAHMNMQQIQLVVMSVINAGDGLLLLYS